MTDLETEFLQIFFVDNPFAMHNYLLGARREMERWNEMLNTPIDIEQRLQTIQEEMEAKLALL